MRAIVIKQYGGPEVLAIEERPAPKAKPGHVVIEVKSFGLNHAEIYFRKGVWGDVAEISGIECVGLVKEDPEGRFYPGQKVAALVGGMGRSMPGSYAELTSVPSTNVVPIKTDLAWEDSAALPQSGPGLDQSHRHPRAGAGPDRSHPRRHLGAGPGGGEHCRPRRRPRHRHDAERRPCRALGDAGRA